MVTRSFVAGSSGTYYFMIRIFNNYLPYFLGFDDFSLEVTPGCQAPVNLTATNITHNSANLAWTPGGSETGWEYVYGASPLSPPAGSGTATTSNTTNSIGGLSPETGYQYYVRSVCGPEYSTWAGPYSFSTLCAPISLYPVQEGFEGGTWPPNCWSDLQNTSYGWDKSTFGAPNFGTEWAFCNLAGSVLKTPLLSLAGDFWLTFWYRAENQNNPQDLEIKIGNDVIFTLSGITNPIYRQAHVSLAAYSGQIVTISFVGQTGTGGIDYGICIDDVSVDITKKWTGNFDSNWNNPGNWTWSLIPGQYDVALIPSAPDGENFPVVGPGVTANCDMLIVQPGATVTVQTGGTLNIKNQ
jgi:hypothetical protein